MPTLVTMCVSCVDTKLKESYNETINRAPNIVESALSSVFLN